MADPRDVGTRHRHLPASEGMSGRSGLPCRAPDCLAWFMRRGAGRDWSIFQRVIADRDAHEWNRHQYDHGVDHEDGPRPRRPSVGPHHGEVAARIGVQRAAENGRRSGEVRRARALARLA